MTPLGELLRERIENAGPIPVAEFMAEALGHPEHGYYMRGDPFGVSGDFVTAPEISQMFGEIIGLWCIAVWELMGQPDPCRLVEIGPGRGTLMADTLRAVQIRPAFREAARVHLVETSAALAKTQRRALAGREAAWHRTFAEAAPMGDGAGDGAGAPAGEVAGERAKDGAKDGAGNGSDGAMPLIVLANEMFDALPVHQLERTAAGWRERLVGFDSEKGRFRFETAAAETPVCALVPARMRDAPAGSVFEVCPAARRLAGEIAGRVAAAGGAALVIDYGHGESALGETLQAVRRHRFHDVLADPGAADITAHVDFEALARAAAEAGAKTYGPLPQSLFLRRLGIEARAAVLLRRATPAQARDIPAALGRLIGDKGMGTLFKVLAITHPGLTAPAGFDASP